MTCLDGEKIINFNPSSHSTVVYSLSFWSPECPESAFKMARPIAWPVGSQVKILGIFGSSPFCKLIYIYITIYIYIIYIYIYIILYYIYIHAREACFTTYLRLGLWGGPAMLSEKAFPMPYARPTKACGTNHNGLDAKLLRISFKMKKLQKMSFLFIFGAFS